MRRPRAFILLLLIALSLFTLRDAAWFFIPVPLSHDGSEFWRLLAWNMRRMEKPILFMALAYLYLVRSLEMLRRDAERKAEREDAETDTPE